MSVNVLLYASPFPVAYAPVGIEFGNATQEYDVDGTTWVNAVSGGSLGGIPDETSSGHKLADCLGSIATAVDGSVLAVRESSGAASATNPLTVQALFENIPKFDVIDIRMMYTGSAAHDVCIEAWDYVNSAFVCLETFSDQTYQTNFSLKVHGAANFVSSGNVILQLLHLDTGNTGHRYDLDYITIIDNG
jgi:hypothetical protein